MYTSILNTKYVIQYIMCFIIILMLFFSLLFYLTFKYMGRKYKKYRDNIMFKSKEYHDSLI